MKFNKKLNWTNRVFHLKEEEISSFCRKLENKQVPDTEDSFDFDRFLEKSLNRDMIIETDAARSV